MGCVNSKGNNKQQQEGQLVSNSGRNEQQKVSGGNNQQQQEPKQGGFLEQGKNRLQSIKNEYDEGKRKKWISEVYVEKTDLFIEFKEWMDKYEPKKEKKQGESKDKESKDTNPFSPENIKKKIGENLKEKISDGIIKAILENFAKGIEKGGKIIQKSDPHVYSFMNSIVGTILTYRFQKKDNTEQFEFLREKTLDRMALTFTALIDEEAKRLGQQGENIDQNTINKIIDQQVEKIFERINSQKDQLIAEIQKQSGILGDKGKQVDEGVQEIMQALQGLGEAKVTIMIQQTKQILSVILKILGEYQQKIRSEVAKAKQEAGIENPSEEYAKIREKFQSEFDKYYNLLNDNIKKFVFSLVDFVMAQAKDEEPDQPEK